MTAEDLCVSAQGLKMDHATLYPTRLAYARAAQGAF